MAQKYFRIFVLRYYLLLKALTFPRALLSETFRISEQTISEQQQKRKTMCRYSRQMETTVYLEFGKLLDVLTVSYGPTPIFQQRRVQIENLDN